MSTAETILFHLELEYGLTMAELAERALEPPRRTVADAERWKAHARDALHSATATAARLTSIDASADYQLHELALRLSML